MNAACPRRVSLIIAGGLPAIPSPTIGATTGDRPAASGLTPAPTGFAFRSKARPSTPTESSSRRRPTRAVWVTDWSFSFRCSPPRVATTQLRFDTARFFTAQERTSTALSPSPSQAHERTRPACRVGRLAQIFVPHFCPLPACASLKNEFFGEPPKTARQRQYVFAALSR